MGAFITIYSIYYNWYFCIYYHLFHLFHLLLGELADVCIYLSLGSRLQQLGLCNPCGTADTAPVGAIELLCVCALKMHSFA